ncbi:MAG: histone-like protein [Promethearchaeota archaeon]
MQDQGSPRVIRLTTLDRILESAGVKSLDHDVPRELGKVLEDIGRQIASFAIEEQKKSKLKVLKAKHVKIAFEIWMKRASGPDSASQDS